MQTKDLIGKHLLMQNLYPDLLKNHTLTHIIAGAKEVIPKVFKLVIRDYDLNNIKEQKGTWVTSCVDTYEITVPEFMLEDMIYEQTGIEPFNGTFGDVVKVGKNSYHDSSLVKGNVKDLKGFNFVGYMLQDPAYRNLRTDELHKPEMAPWVIVYCEINDGNVYLGLYNFIELIHQCSRSCNNYKKVDYGLLHFEEIPLTRFLQLLMPNDKVSVIYDRTPNILGEYNKEAIICMQPKMSDLLLSSDLYKYDMSAFIGYVAFVKGNPYVIVDVIDNNMVYGIPYSCGEIIKRKKEDLVLLKFDNYTPSLSYLPVYIVETQRGRYRLTPVNTWKRTLSLWRLKNDKRAIEGGDTFPVYENSFINYLIFEDYTENHYKIFKP